MFVVTDRLTTDRLPLYQPSLVTEGIPGQQTETIAQWELLAMIPLRHGWPRRQHKMIEIRHKETGEVLQRVAGESLAGADLHGADLRWAGLDGADLLGMNLQQADLLCISLRGARLQRAQLQGARCSYADLSGASLQGATLRGAKMVLAQLAGADLGDADLEGAMLSAASLLGATLRRTNLRGSNLCGVDFRGASLTEVDLDGAELGEPAHGSGTVPIPRLAGAAFDSSTRWPAGFDPRAWGALPSDEPILVSQIRYPSVDLEWFAERNLRRWQGIISFYEKFIGQDGRWQWLTPMLRLVRELAGSERAGRYRAGQSLYNLVISTKVEHGLEAGDSYVVVHPSPDSRFKVIYSRATHDGWEEHECGQEELMCALDPLLDRLWIETQG